MSKKRTYQMSNRVRRKDKGREPYVLLNAGNIKETAKLLGYSVKECEEILLKAAIKGYAGVRLPRPRGR